MRKLKLYFDTSTFSHLFADDAPDNMKDTWELWQELIDDKHEVYISQVVLDEIEKCPEPKQSSMLAEMQKVKLNFLQKSDEVAALANEYVKAGVLTQKSFNDCMHIAHAVINNCDLIVSWNFKHLVNFNTIDKVRVVNAIHRYKEMNIITPTILVSKEDE